MKQRSLFWQAAGFALTTLGGTLLHFLYDWTKENMFAAPFSGVNESTWEHMKLLYWPMFLFALVQWIFHKDLSSFWCSKLLSILLGLVLIPVLFYTYNGAFGKSPDWVNIAIFYIAAAAAFLLEWCLFKKEPVVCQHPGIAFAGICFLGGLFIVFTFLPPQIPLFADPVSGNYGVIS